MRRAAASLRSFAARDCVGGRKAIGVGEWALRSAAECTCHPSVGLWDKEWLSCGVRTAVAPPCGGTCQRAATVLLAVLVGVDDGLGVWRVCVGRLLARVACRGEATSVPTARGRAATGVDSGYGASAYTSGSRRMQVF